MTLEFEWRPKGDSKTLGMTLIIHIFQWLGRLKMSKSTAQILPNAYCAATAPEASSRATQNKDFILNKDQEYRIVGVVMEKKKWYK